MTPTIDEYPCIMHDRGEKCGTTFYSFTAHGHTVGTCAPKGRKFTAKIQTDKASGQITLLLLDASGDVVAGVGGIGS
jgi:hypothetical protein